uniref:PDZ domain-containing protein n=1 Tax=Sinocyclocheilus anshuiensis TaxID=1608454 RepID=A0A671M2I0_9TELE
MYWLFPELALPANNQGWPEDFGFKLGGDGPSYILSVVEGSSAYMAGLQPGDQVLEIDGQNVSSLSTKALISSKKCMNGIATNFFFPQNNNKNK